MNYADISNPNGVDTPPELVVNGNDKPLLNGQHLNGQHINGKSSSCPEAESPDTPVSITTAPDVKIAMDYQEQESDVRHEPIMKSIDAVDRSDTASIISQPGTPADPSTIPVHPPAGTPPPPSGDLLEDVKLAETVSVTGDVVMGDVGDAMTETPVTTPGLLPDSSMATIVSNGASTSYSSPHNQPLHDDDHKPPPAKRARIHSDADIASLAHSASPPPPSVVASDTNTPVPPSPDSSTLSVPQYRFCLGAVRQLKKQKDAVPFLRPVDPIALNIPHYPSIIKTPMDLSTIERKVISSNTAKPDLNSQNPRYHSADEFINDVRLIFQNCLTFNGPDHAISAMGKRLEQMFDKTIKQMPAAEPKPPVVKKVATPPPPQPVPPSKKASIAARRASTSVPVIRRSDTETVGRPKREIHPPPPKDLLYVDAPKKHRKTKRAKDDGTAEQLRFCSKLLSDIHRKQYYGIANPFYEPVDWVALDLPTYPKIVKKPMDLSTIRKKLDEQQYPTAQKFFDDFKLMIRNCFLFNPGGTPVNQAGIELQRVFDEKWKQLPPLREVVSEDDDEEDEEDSEDERQRTIAMMESQIETMRGNIAALKNTKLPKEKKKKEKRDRVPVASSSKATAKSNKAATKKKNKKLISDNDVLTFEQKKDLSESIGKLDGAKLERVINIIHEGVPEIRDSTEEIELEIDTLPASVLTKLYNFVIRPMRTPATKRNRTGKGTGTGGLKRKSMDEDVEAEKIRMLEERMALFSNPNARPPPHIANDSDRSSDSSDSDSSGSDSE